MFKRWWSPETADSATARGHYAFSHTHRPSHLKEALYSFSLALLSLEAIIKYNKSDLSASSMISRSDNQDSYCVTDGRGEQCRDPAGPGDESRPRQDGAGWLKMSPQYSEPPSI